MADETAPGSSEATDGGGHPQGGGEVSSPLQARAAFLENWNWKSVVSINRGACSRGGAQHGFNSEAKAACQKEWEELRVQEISLGETVDRLRAFHRKAPFLFFNGNTFAAIGRELAFALFSDLPMMRKREIGSAVAHYIAGVLDCEAMEEIINTLWKSSVFQAGDRVRTLRGSLRGKIVRILDDGRIVWRPDGATHELTGLPESLTKEEK